MSEERTDQRAKLPMVDEKKYNSNNLDPLRVNPREADNEVRGMYKSQSVAELRGNQPSKLGVHGSSGNNFFSNRNS